MKNAKRKTLCEEIGRSMNRFLMILFIVALELRFCGIRLTRPDMELSVDAHYDETNLMDIRIAWYRGPRMMTWRRCASSRRRSTRKALYHRCFCEGADREKTVRIFR